MIISKLFFTALPIPSSDTVCVRVCVVSVIVKRPVLPPCVVDGRSRNPLYYSYSYLRMRRQRAGWARRSLTAEQQRGKMRVLVAKG